MIEVQSAHNCVQMCTQYNFKFCYILHVKNKQQQLKHKYKYGVAHVTSLYILLIDKQTSCCNLKTRHQPSSNCACAESKNRAKIEMQHATLY